MRVYVLIVAISLLPFISFFLTTDIPHTHDGPVHLARMAAYYKALTSGQILPRWASDLNYGYGMPLFNFIYHTPYLISSFFLTLGFGLVSTFKLVLALSYVLSGIGMLLFAREFWKNDRTAFLVAVFYQFAPFRLAETHIRGSFGEVYTYAALPFILYGFVIGNVPITAMSTAVLILSHNSISLIFFVMAATFAILHRKNIFGLLLGLTLSATYWLPAILERKYTYGDLFMKEIYARHFTPLLTFFLPNFTGDPRLITEGIPVQIGLFHVIALAAAIIYYKKPLSKYILTWSAIAIFFMHNASSFIWENMAILRQFQFPWRFLAASVVTTSFAAGFLRLGSKFAFVMTIVLLIVSTVWYWNPSLGFDRIASEQEYWDFKLNTTFYGETDVIWSAGPHLAYPPSQLQIAQGIATVSAIVKRPTEHTFSVSAKSDATIVDNTQYFPGWRVYIDNKQVPIEFQDINWRGLITFPVSTGDHAVRVVFGRTPVRLVADILSVSTMILLLFIWLKKKYIYR